MTGFVAVSSPLDDLGDTYLLSAHMLQHVLIMDVAPALAVVAVRGPLAYFFLPRRIFCQLARRPFVRRTLATLTTPRVALAVWVSVLAGWHIPAAYDYALTHPLVHDAEHALFLISGALVWTVLIDPGRHKRSSIGARLSLAKLMFVGSSLLSLVLILSPITLYPSYADQTVRVFGISATTDQQLAGLVMLIEQGATLAICVFCLLRQQPRRSPSAMQEATMFYDLIRRIPKSGGHIHEPGASTPTLRPRNPESRLNPSRAPDL